MECRQEEATKEEKKERDSGVHRSCVPSVFVVDCSHGDATTREVRATRLLAPNADGRLDHNEAHQTIDEQS